MTAEEPESLREIWQILTHWLSPRRALAQAREIRRLSALPTTEVWRLSRWTVIFVAAVVAAALIGTAVDARGTYTPSGIEFAFAFTTSVVALCAAIYFRWRLIVTSDEVVIVKWFRTKRFPLVAVESAYTDDYGLTFQLIDDRVDSNGWLQLRTCGCLQTANVQRWLGKESRADRVAAYVVRRAAEARGEDPSSANVAQIRRGTGNLFMGFWVAMTSVFR